MQQRSFVLSVSLPPWLRILEQRMLEISSLEFITKDAEAPMDPVVEEIGGMNALSATK